MTIPRFLRAVLFTLLFAPIVQADEWLIVGPIRGGSRGLVGSEMGMDLMFGSEAPRWPKAGDKLGDKVWKQADYPPAGFEAEELAPGYVCGRIDSPTDKVVLMCGDGATYLNVNGVQFAGDVYASSMCKVPVALKKGVNMVLARTWRGTFKLDITDPPAPVCLLEEDLMVPSFINGNPQGEWGAVPILNATADWVRGLSLECGKSATPVPPLPPLSITKIPFPVGSEAKTSVRIKYGDSWNEIQISMGPPGKPTHPSVWTFRSAIDDSAQWYAWLPPEKFDPAKTYGMVLTLHGAGVGANGQAAAYAQRDWCAVVAPTNRRPFGFDWEEWGRLDGLEVLAEGKKLFKCDDSRIFVAGHSMGGHGTWQFAVQYPDLWAGASPSAGWPSLWTYPPSAQRDPNPDLADPFRRSSAPGNTVGLVRNLTEVPLFILHGDKDDNVPLEQATKMCEILKEFHTDYRLWVKPGGGHWWGGDGPGADCVSLPELFDWMQHRRRPEWLSKYEFRTYSPAVASHCREIDVLAQTNPYGLSTVKVKRQVTPPALTVSTDNVSHIKVAWPATILLDGAEPPAGNEWHRENGAWVAGPPPGLHKSPALQGPFAQAFHKPFVFVVPTGGDAAERDAATAFARYQTSVWWYRGNGRGEVLLDSEVTAEDWKNRNLILLGNSVSNSCWAKVAARLPFDAKPGQLTITGEDLAGDLSLAAIYPNPENPSRLLAVIGASGPAGRRGWWAMSWWNSGSGTPDLLAWDGKVFTDRPGSIKALGFFGADWKPATGAWTVTK